MIKAPKNSLIVVVDGKGGRYMSADGTKLYKDDAGKIDVELEARNSKPCPQSTCPHTAPGEEYVPHQETRTIPVVHLKEADIAGVPMVNLKNEPV